MSKTEELECVIREAVPSDAEQVIAVLNKTAHQTGFMTQGDDLELTVEEEAKELDRIYTSSNNCVLVAVVGEEIVGVASIHGSQKPKIAHIGEVGIVIDKEFWGMGLGRLMMEEMIQWAEEDSIITRLELQVQARNDRARSLYKHLGFTEEAVIKRGVKDAGEYLDVCLMSKLIN